VTYRIDRKRYATLAEAKAYAERLFQTKGIVAAIEGTNTMTKYQIVTNKARDSEIIESACHPIVAFAERGFRHCGFNNNRVNRVELQGQPKFEGLCGPMWGGTEPDGTPVVRYEDWGSYEVLSR
jgi:hypothetical protein